MNDRRNTQQLPEAPAVFEAAIQLGGRQIRTYERRKRAVRRAATVAACVVLTVAAVLMISMRPGIPDSSMTLAKQDSEPGEVRKYPALREVWVHPEDGYFHEDSECTACHAEAVRMQRDTAQEFEKEACPECVGWEN